MTIYINNCNNSIYNSINLRILKSHVDRHVICSMRCKVNALIFCKVVNCIIYIIRKCVILIGIYIQYGNLSYRLSRPTHWKAAKQVIIRCQVYSI